MLNASKGEGEGEAFGRYRMGMWRLSEKGNEERLRRKLIKTNSY